MEPWIVLIVAASAVVLFATEKLGVDVVALLVMGALVAGGLVSVEEGLSGFGSAATTTVAAMFVLSAGLNKSGALDALGRALVRFGRSESTLRFLVMIAAGVLSPFMNNTAVVAVLLPLALGAARDRGISASRLLIPLSYASQFGGVCTLIGTSTNLVVHAIAEQNGVRGFSMFEFARLGVVLFVAGTVYCLLFSRWLLPARNTGQLTTDYQLGEYVTELRVMPGSPVIGQTAAGLKLGESHDVTLLEILRGDGKIWSPAHEPLKEGDLLLVRGAVRKLVDLKNRARLEIEPQFKLQDDALEDKNLELTEVLLAPGSRIAGRTLRNLDFLWRYRLVVLALQRRGQVLREKLAEARLDFGDALLLLGPRTEVDRLREDDDFIVLESRQDVMLRRGRAPIALGIVTAVVALAALQLLPIAASALLGCVAMVLTGCLRSEDAYRAVDWKVIMLLAGMLPLGLALQRTGAAQGIVDGMLGWAGQANPVLLLALLYLLTSVLTEFMSNNATAALLTPVAIVTASKLGLSPTPFLIAVTFAASTSFATPVGYQTNSMVYNVGGYRFLDFLRFGLPLNLLFWILATLLIPWLWPFNAPAPV